MSNSELIVCVSSYTAYCYTLTRPGLFVCRLPIYLLETTPIVKIILNHAQKYEETQSRLTADTKPLCTAFPEYEVGIRPVTGGFVTHASPGGKTYDLIGQYIWCYVDCRVEFTVNGEFQLYISLVTCDNTPVIHRKVSLLFVYGFLFDTTHTV